MSISFSKYQGTGNDFVMIDNSSGSYNLTTEQIVRICDRKFGVGADGLILLNNKEGFDFEMDYYNSDGSKSFCGNGARCTVQFFIDLGYQLSTGKFWAIDGEHIATMEDSLISIRMADVSQLESLQSNFLLDTGSPHFVNMASNLDSCNIVEYGKAVRFSSMFEKEGVNVNQLEVLGQNQIRIKTYERGVEDETLSCGTGATASAIVYGYLNLEDGVHRVKVKVEGGNLEVKFLKKNGKFTEIELIGPALEVFKGVIGDV